MQNEIEHFFTCPYCMQQISMLLESLPDKQTYVEDCEVCCRPIQIHFLFENDHLQFFEAQKSNE